MRSALRALVLLCVVTSTGCISYYGVRPPETSSGLVAQKPLCATSEIVYAYRHNGGADNPNFKSEDVKAAIQQAIGSSRLVSSDVDESRKNQRLRVSVTTNEQSSAVLALLSGLTLTLIPYWGETEIDAEVQVVGKGDEVVASAREKASIKFACELFLVFGMPFVDKPPSMPDTVRAVVAKACADIAEKR